MPKPRRRRRFFALEGRFEVGDSGELEGIAEPTPSTTGETEDVLSREIDSEQPGISEAAGAVEESTEETLPRALQLTRASRSRPAQKRPSLWSTSLLALACLGLGSFAGYRLAKHGQNSSAPDASDNPGSPQKGVITLSPTDDEELDAAYDARHAHRYDEAKKFFNALERRHPDWGPIKVEQGRTLFYENNSYDASVVLKTAAERGWKPAEAYFLLGVLNKGRQSFPQAELCFARAVAIDPTEPEYYFFWGECLRGEGKLLEATAKLRSALLRSQYETATGLYQAKLWLCAIEAGQEGTADLNAEIDAALAQPQPPMAAFVAVAARNLRAGNFSAAAANLSRARRRADAMVFRYIISDPVFVPGYSQPELAKFFQFAIPPTSQGTDPAGSSMTENASAAPQPSASPEKANKP